METIQCPVCTLYLREGMTLDSHLDTHPKDQVIRALCALSVVAKSTPATTPVPPPSIASPMVSSVESFDTFSSASFSPTPFAAAPASFAPVTFAVSPAPPRTPHFPRILPKPSSFDSYPVTAFGNVTLLAPKAPPRNVLRILSDVKIQHPSPSRKQPEPIEFLAVTPPPRNAFSVIKNVGKPPQHPHSPKRRRSREASDDEPPATRPKSETETAPTAPPSEGDLESEGDAFWPRPEKVEFDSFSADGVDVDDDVDDDDDFADASGEFAMPDADTVETTETFLSAPADSKIELPDEMDGERPFAALGSDTALSNDDDAIDIRTDERMPPRGELSEQESSGDADAPWAGIYGELGGSTSYDRTPRDVWTSDGSDVETPDLKDDPNTAENESEDIPIVVCVKPPEKNYRCATCGKAFDCPKERRVHRSKEHSSTSTSTSVSMSLSLPEPPQEDAEKKRKQSFAKTVNVKIEADISTEGEKKETPTPESSIPPPEGVEGKITSVVEFKFLKPDPTKEMDFVKAESNFTPLRTTIKRTLRERSCLTCKAEFTTEASYKEHLKIHPLECLQCGKLFNRRANLQLHIKRHLGIKNFKCDVCNKGFVTKQKMIEHYNVHTGKTPIKCSMCDLSFRRHSNMVQHRNRFHFQVKRRIRDYVCSCGEVFHSKKKLAWHKEIHDDRPKACLHCNEKFVHAASLTRHVRRAHNNYFVPDEKRKGENVRCSVCGNVYLKSSIDMHMKTHVGTKAHSCVICNKSFTTRWNLKLHKWTHANRSSKPYKCNLCKGAFIRQTDYVSHMNAHKSVRPYTCNHCGCQFIRKYNCQRHVKEHENEKKYICNVPDCGKTFHRSYYLTEHLKVHSGVRPFSCNICGKTSSTKSNHNKHLKIHHAREPITSEG